eukprot:757481-Hanusia_phi.AAC.1
MIHLLLDHTTQVCFLSSLISKYLRLLLLLPPLRHPASSLHFREEATANFVMYPLPSLQIHRCSDLGRSGPRSHSAGTPGRESAAAHRGRARHCSRSGDPVSTSLSGAGWHGDTVTDGHSGALRLPRSAAARPGPGQCPPGDRT